MRFEKQKALGKLPKIYLVLARTSRASIFIIFW